MRGRTLLACGLLLLEDCVDVIHLAQPLEEGDEVQQLGVGHVVEPRGHRHLEENTNYQQRHQHYLSFTVYLFFFYIVYHDAQFCCLNQQSDFCKNAAQMDMVTFSVFPHVLCNITVEHVINQQNRTQRRTK